MEAVRQLAAAFACLLRDERGQAMVEYSTITFLLLVGLAVAGAEVPIFSYMDQRATLVELLYRSLQTYVDSVNFALSLAAT